MHSRVNSLARPQRLHARALRASSPEGHRRAQRLPQLAVQRQRLAPHPTRASAPKISVKPSIVSCSPRFLRTHAVDIGQGGSFQGKQPCMRMRGLSSSPSMPVS